MRDLSPFSNEELLELAYRRRLIDLYQHAGRHVVLYLDGKKLTLSLPQTRVFLGGLLWGTRDAGCRPA